MAIAFDENGEVAPVPIDDPLMDELFPLAEACVADLGPGVTLLRSEPYNNIVECLFKWKATMNMQWQVAEQATPMSEDVRP